MIGCDCKVCTSDDARDKRLRPSILIRYDGHAVLIDTTPDFRQQALRAKIDRLDAILFTHSHADHIMGLDDVRPFNFRQREMIPIFAAEETLNAIKTSFRYVFADSNGLQTAIPKLKPTVLTGEPFDIFGLRFAPIPVTHGKATIYGFRFGDAAYLTDHSDIPESSLDLLRGLDVLFLDALRYKPHPTHSTVQRSLEYVEMLKPRRAYFTHICHDLHHRPAEGQLPANVRLAYDGLDISVGDHS